MPTKAQCGSRMAESNLKHNAKSNSVSQSLRLGYSKTIPNTAIVSPGERIMGSKKSYKKHIKDDGINVSLESMAGSFYKAVKVYGSMKTKALGKGFNKTFDPSKNKRKGRMKPMAEGWKSYELTEDVITY